MTSATSTATVQADEVRALALEAVEVKLCGSNDPNTGPRDRVNHILRLIEVAMTCGNGMITLTVEDASTICRLRDLAHVQQEEGR